MAEGNQGTPDVVFSSGMDLETLKQSLVKAEQLVNESDLRIIKLRKSITTAQDKLDKDIEEKQKKHHREFIDQKKEELLLVSQSLRTQLQLFMALEKELVRQTSKPIVQKVIVKTELQGGYPTGGQGLPPILTQQGFTPGSPGAGYGGYPSAYQPQGGYPTGGGTSYPSGYVSGGGGLPSYMSGGPARTVQGYPTGGGTPAPSGYVPYGGGYSGTPIGGGFAAPSPYINTSRGYGPLQAYGTSPWGMYGPVPAPFGQFPAPVTGRMTGPALPPGWQVNRMTGMSQMTAPPSSGGRMGGAGMNPFLTSLGFGMMGANIPGMRAVSSLAIGSGFGGQAGLAGAGVAVGITAAIVGVQKLIGLYETLAEKASHLESGQIKISGVMSQTSDTIEASFYPALKHVQEVEEKIADWLTENQGTVATVTDDVAKLASSIFDLGTGLLLLVTNSNDINEALATIGDTVHVFAGLAQNIVDMANGLVKIGNMKLPETQTGPLPSVTPGWNLMESVIGANTGNYEDAKKAGQFNVPYTPEETGSPLLRSMGGMAGYKALLVKQKEIRALKEAASKIAQGNEPSDEKIGQLREELKSKEEQFELAKKQFALETDTGRDRLELLLEEADLNKQIKDIELKKEESLRSQGRFSFERAKALEDELAFEKEIQKVKEDVAGKELDRATRKRIGAEEAGVPEIERAHSEVVGLEAQVAQFGGGPLAIPTSRLMGGGRGLTGTTGPSKTLLPGVRIGEATKQTGIQSLEKQLELRIKLIAAQQAEAKLISDRDAKIVSATEAEIKAREKLDGIIADGQREQFDLTEKIREAQNKEELEYLDRLVANREILNERKRIIQETIRAIEELDRAQSGITNNPATQQIAAGQFPEGPFGERQPISEAGMRVMRRAGLEAGKTNVEQLIRNTQETRATMEAKLAKPGQSPAERQQLIRDIQASKDEEIKFNDQLIITLRALQVLAGPGTEAYANLQSAIDGLNTKTIDLTENTLTFGEALTNTLQTIISHASAFNSVLGKVAGTAALAGKSVMDLSKIKLLDKKGNITDTAAGSIGAGLKAGFGNVKSALAQGIPMAGEILSAALGVVSALKDMFTKAAKVMAEAIGKEVGRLEKIASQTGKLNDAITGLEAQRTKAMTELASKKGGQKQLETLLPQIDDAIAALKKQQQDIVDSFMNALHALSEDPAIESLIESWDAINTKVRQFINAAGESAETYTSAFDMIERSAERMSANLQDQVDATKKAWLQGAENEQGELISLDDDAARKMQENVDNYNKTYEALEKQRHDLVKSNNEAELADKKALLDLNKQELIDIKSIQNEGIAERQKTTQEDKRQRIADLQDANSKVRKEITDARDARREAFTEQMAQIQTAEETARHNMDNTYLRISNEMERSRTAFLEKLDQYEQQRVKIAELENFEGLAIYRIQEQWEASMRARSEAYQRHIDEVVDQNNRLNEQGTLGYNQQDIRPNYLTPPAPVITLESNIEINGSNTVTKEDVQDIVSDQMDTLVSRIPVRR